MNSEKQYNFSQKFKEKVKNYSKTFIKASQTAKSKYISSKIKNSENVTNFSIILTITRTNDITEPRLLQNRGSDISLNRMNSKRMKPIDRNPKYLLLMPVANLRKWTCTTGLDDNSM